jgi:3alpha(or 20beta)-hydroxysteroid dehydrogenase
MSEPGSRDRVVLVTGAAGGMGAGHARHLAAAGWTVVLADVADCTPVLDEITSAAARPRPSRST